ncbi:MAG: tail fiber domain-containing protein [Bacteroidota bacterium]
MKTLLTIFQIFVLTALGHWSQAQIYIDANEDVGVGQLDTENSRMRVVNSGNAKGLYLTQSYGGAGPSWGIQNMVTAVGTGEKIGVLNQIYQDDGSTAETTGLESWTHGYGTGYAYGMQNWISNAGTGRKIGYFGFFNQKATASTSLYAVTNYLRNYGSGSTFGQYQYFYETGLGKKEGWYNIMLQPILATTLVRGSYNDLTNNGTGETVAYEAQVAAAGRGKKYGYRGVVIENSNSLDNTRGIQNLTYLYGVTTGYGLYNRVYELGTSSAVKYGIYNYVEDLSTGSDDKYGIYNYLEKSGGGTNYALWSGVQNEGDYAGYFHGDVVVTGSVMEGVSDARLKENTQQLKSALSLIRKLTPKTYHFKKNMGIPLPDGPQYGLIAQELEVVIPDLVDEFKAPGAPIYRTVAQERSVDLLPNGGGAGKTPDGSDQVGGAELQLDSRRLPATEEIVGYEEDQRYKVINYRGLIPILVGAIQEQQAQIESLRAEVEALRRGDGVGKGK